MMHGPVHIKFNCNILVEFPALPFLSAHHFYYSLISLARAECDDSLPFSGASSIPLCYVFFLPRFSTIYSSILSHLILPSISWSTSQSCCSQFIYNTLLGILFSSILCTCPNQRNLFNLVVSTIVGLLTTASISLLVNILQFSFSLSYTGPKILLCTFLSKMFNFFPSPFVSVQVSDAYVYCSVNESLNQRRIVFPMAQHPLGGQCLLTITIKTHYTR